MFNPQINPFMQIKAPLCLLGLFPPGAPRMADSLDVWAQFERLPTDHTLMKVSSELRLPADPASIIILYMDLYALLGAGNMTQSHVPFPRLSHKKIFNSDKLSLKSIKSNHSIV